jgi:hypothetical protein
MTATMTVSTLAIRLVLIGETKHAAPIIAQLSMINEAACMFLSSNGEQW